METLAEYRTRRAALSATPLVPLEEFNSKFARSDYTQTPQWRQQYGLGGIGYAGNGLGSVRGTDPILWMQGKTPSEDQWMQTLRQERRSVVGREIRYKRAA